MASVGDDNSLTLSELRVSTSAGSSGQPVVTLTSQCSEKNAHSSSITGNLLIYDEYSRAGKFRWLRFSKRNIEEPGVALHGT